MFTRTINNEIVNLLLVGKIRITKNYDGGHYVEAYTGSGEGEIPVVWAELFRGDMGECVIYMDRLLEALHKAGKVIEF